MKTSRNLHIHRSLDPTWTKWLVIHPNGMSSIWVDSEAKALALVEATKTWDCVVEASADYDRKAKGVV